MESRIKEALTLLGTSHEGALATLEETRSFISAVSYLYDPPPAGERWGKIHLLLSELARHTHNLQKNPNVSLMAIEPGPAPAYEKRRVTVQGVIRWIKDDAKFKEFKERYIRIFPSSERLFDFTDFRFFEIEITDVHWIAGFGKIESFK